MERESAGGTRGHHLDPWHHGDHSGGRGNKRYSSLLLESLASVLSCHRGADSINTGATQHEVYVWIAEILPTEYP